MIYDLVGIITALGDWFYILVFLVIFIILVVIEKFILK